jgi:hypothetical protein
MVSLKKKVPRSSQATCFALKCSENTIGVPVEKLRQGKIFLGVATFDFFPS